MIFLFQNCQLIFILRILGGSWKILKVSMKLLFWCLFILLQRGSFVLMSELCSLNVCGPTSRCQRAPINEIVRVSISNERWRAGISDQRLLAGLLYSHEVLVSLFLISQMHIQLYYLSIFLTQWHLQILDKLLHLSHLFGQLESSRFNLGNLFIL